MGQVEDHNPPHMGQIFAFLERAGLFCTENEENVVAVSMRSLRCRAVCGVCGG